MKFDQRRILKMFIFYTKIMINCSIIFVMVSVCYIKYRLIVRYLLKGIF